MLENLGAEITEPKYEIPRQRPVSRAFPKKFYPAKEPLGLLVDVTRWGENRDRSLDILSRVAGATKLKRPGEWPIGQHRSGSLQIPAGGEDDFDDFEEDDCGDFDDDVR